MDDLAKSCFEEKGVEPYFAEPSAAEKATQLCKRTLPTVVARSVFSALPVSWKRRSRSTSGIGSYEAVEEKILSAAEETAAGNHEE
jgi:hypothetical protein